MSSIDIVSMGIRNLFKRKLRTFLTVLGVIVGTAAIVIMISLGIGINESFKKQMDEMGDLTTITVYRPYDSMMMSSGGVMSASSAKGRPSLDDEAIDNFSKIDGVVVATPVMELGMKFKSGKYEAWIYVKGMEPAAMEALGYKTEAGRLIDPNSTKYEVLFGSEMPYRFANPNDRNAWMKMYAADRTANIDVLTDKIEAHYDYAFGDKNNPDSAKLRGYKIETAGLLSMVEGNNGYDINYSAFMDINKLKKIENDQKLAQRRAGVRNNGDGYTGYQMAYVKCTDIKNVPTVLETIRDEYKFDAYNPTDWVNSMKEMSASLQALLGAIGAVSLFVAAIGIANTMIMSIYERTREIGVMKVIGASLRDIKRLFLLEAALIGFLGGFFGIFVSLGVSMLINKVGLSFLSAIVYNPDGASAVSSVPLWLCGAALAFATVIGLISGYFPARRAMKLSALNAIRTE